MASDKQPVCSASLLFQSPYYDRHVAFTTELFTAVATSSHSPSSHYKWTITNTIHTVMTAQTMSFHYELACKGFSMEKAQQLVT